MYLHIGCIFVIINVLLALPYAPCLMVTRTCYHRYGNTIVGMDATYRTTKYGLPMFVMTVIDNHGHGQPIAMFFVQEENGDSIAEVLHLFKEVNPLFQPSYFMIDKSDMEMNGIKEVYPDTCVLICDFHR
jgi:MULE transposase domain